MYGKGELKPAIPHPHAAGDQLFFLIDPTHNIKNIFNNWLRQGEFHLMLNSSEGSENITAYFTHIIRLYEKEEAMVLKVAHKLQKGYLNPSNIQKTCPQLALGKCAHSVSKETRPKIRLFVLSGYIASYPF